MTKTARLIRVWPALTDAAVGDDVVLDAERDGLVAIRHPAYREPIAYVHASSLEMYVQMV